MTNEQFETAVIEACKTHLRDDIDAEHYASVVLDELYGDEGYDEKYYEISQNHTKSGNPFVIS